MRIEITRAQLRPARPGGRVPACWTYDYTVEGDPALKQYGPGLVSLHSMLKHRFPDAQVIETWAVACDDEEEEIRRAERQAEARSGIPREYAEN